MLCFCDPTIEFVKFLQYLLARKGNKVSKGTHFKYEKPFLGCCSLYIHITTFVCLCWYLSAKIIWNFFQIFQNLRNFPRSLIAEFATFPMSDLTVCINLAVCMIYKTVCMIFISDCNTWNWLIYQGKIEIYVFFPRSCFLHLVCCLLLLRVGWGILKIDR